VSLHRLLQIQEVQQLRFEFFTAAAAAQNKYTWNTILPLILDQYAYTS
jgi:hypothetical protein